MFPTYKICFKIKCPFDALGLLSPQDSEIRCCIPPGKAPVFGPPNVCDACNAACYEQCEKCVTALYLMFQQGRISLDFNASHSVQTLPIPIRPSLALLSEQQRHSLQ